MVRFFYFALFVAAGLWAVSASAGTSTDEVTAYRAFVEINDPAVTILSQESRSTLASDSLSGSADLASTANKNISATLMEPHSRSYLRVAISTASEATYKVLRRGKKDIVGVVYTVGDSATVRDSELRFYDSRFRPIALKRVMTPLCVEDFFDFTGVDKETRISLLAMLPFMAVEYGFAPDSDEMTARLTAVEALSREDQRRLAPYLRSLRLVWDGKKYRRMSGLASGR
ncbi:MAG: DUF3256 family protein [Lepagella sp.]